MTDLDRRFFLRGLIAAPAVIRVAPLMRITAFSSEFPAGWRVVNAGGALSSADVAAALEWDRLRRWSKLVDAAFKRGVPLAQELRSFRVQL